MREKELTKESSSTDRGNDERRVTTTSKQWVAKNGNEREGHMERERGRREREVIETIFFCFTNNGKVVLKTNKKKINSTPILLNTFSFWNFILKPKKSETYNHPNRGLNYVKFIKVQFQSYIWPAWLFILMESSCYLWIWAAWHQHILSDQSRKQKKRTLSLVISGKNKLALYRNFDFDLLTSYNEDTDLLIRKIHLVCMEKSKKKGPQFNHTNL